jgi:adenosylcobinamide-GDP ribazoletransferase
MQAASVRGAVSFLTRVPVGGAVDADDVARGAALFPLVGAGVGALSGAVAVLLHPTLSPLLAATAAVAVAAVLTGGMHLDALADTADGLGAHSRVRALEIMRDSRVGTFGATALVLDLLLKVGAVATLLVHGDALASLVAAGALSRSASPPLAATLPYPRVEGGPGSVLSGRTSVGTATFAVVLAVAAALLLGRAWLIVAVAVVAVLLGLFYRRWLGGATGDCLGAATELSETLALVVAAALAG